MPTGIPNPNTIKPDMSDYPYPGMSDPEAYKVWKREYTRRFRVLNLEHERSRRRATPIRRNPNYIKPDMSDYPFPGRSDPEAFKAWKREYTRRSRVLNLEHVRSRLQAYNNSAEGRAVREAYQKSAEGKASKKKTGAHRKQVKSMIPLTEQERQQLIILERDRLHLTETTGIQHHLDHIMPLSKGGIHHPINLRIITAEENISKGDKVTPEAMALIPQIQAIVNERKGWLNTEQDSTLADLFTTTEDET